MNNAAVGNPPVVVAVDGSGATLAATRWAAAEAERWNAPLQIVNAYGHHDIAVGARVYPPLEWLEAKAAASRNLLRDAARLANDVAPRGGVIVEATAEEVGPTLLELSRGARMAVLGKPGGAVVDLLTGDPTAEIAAHARCPVVVVRGRDAESGPVVVGVDGSPAGEAAVAHAFGEASIRNVPLIALHVCHDRDARGHFGGDTAQEAGKLVLSQRLSGWREKYPEVDVELVVLPDKPRQRLLEWSEKAQLLVVGSRGRGGFAGLVLGSTSQALIHHASCPVMIARTAPES